MNTRARLASPAGVSGGDGGDSTPSTLRQRHGKPWVSKPHRKWVAEHGCMVCGADAVPHHLLKPWRGIRGTSRKAPDENCVPLCPRHHQGHDESLHTIGEETFFFDHFGHVAAGRGEAERLYLASPHGAALEQGEPE